VIFSSVEFFVMLALVLALMRMTTSENTRRNVLLVASYFSYGWWDWRFCLLIWTTTTIDYIAGIQLERLTDQRKRRLWLVGSLSANLGMMFYFKYTNFFLGSLRPLLAGAGIHVPHLNIVLPVGISFFTFHSMSYTIDVYWRKLKATHNYRDFLLFVAFFPQLVAGPIVRGSQMLPQLEPGQQHPVRGDNIRRGFELFLKGFVKKVLFADTLAMFADPVFGHPAAFGSWTTWLAVIAYAGQIYYDFSGYTDMALGIGRVCGFDLPVNFRHPYLSRSITEFWRRWHISLSTWLRDYLYIPLGGNRKGLARTYVNLMLTMLLGGLWHGASWTFVVWGGLHGLALAADKLRMDLQRRGPEDLGSPVDRAIGWTLTFVFVLVTWVFFRAQTFGDAWTMLRKMAFLDTRGASWLYVQALAAIGLAVVAHVWVAARNERELLVDLRRPLAWTVAFAGILMVLFFSPFSSNPFIYFQF
jgi:alginate O-acetyltransferase complex protein AlgI